MDGNFGPLPAGSTILWQTDHFIMYVDENQKVWRYMHEFHARWPVEFNPPIKLPDPVAKRAEMLQNGLSQKEIEELI